MHIISWSILVSLHWLSMLLLLNICHSILLKFLLKITVISVIIITFLKCNFGFTTLCNEKKKKILFNLNCEVKPVSSHSGLFWAEQCSKVVNLLITRWLQWVVHKQTVLRSDEKNSTVQHYNTGMFIYIHSF